MRQQLESKCEVGLVVGGLHDDAAAEVVGAGVDGRAGGGWGGGRDGGAGGWRPEAAGPPEAGLLV
uniref:Uncharacterized protein n=1 Tax=Oryza brachyantha TaxID=4533 RepID=J3LLT8_ORYBR